MLVFLIGVGFDRKTIRKGILPKTIAEVKQGSPLLGRVAAQGASAALGCIKPKAVRLDSPFTRRLAYMAARPQVGIGSNEDCQWWLFTCHYIPALRHLEG